MKNIVLISILVLTFASCEKEKTLDLKLDSFEEKMVLHGFISSINGVEIVVKKTVSAEVTNGDDKLNNPQVVLNDNNGGNVNLVTSDNKHFSLPANIIINPAHKYSVKAFSTKYSAVSDTISIVNPVQIDSIVNEISISDGKKYLKIYYNNPNMNNRYYIRTLYYKNGDIIDNYNQSDVKFDPYDILVPQNLGINFYREQYYSIPDSVEVKFYTLSNELIKYYNSYINYINNAEDVYAADAYPIFSNISGGIGIFGSYAYDNKILRNN